jgi:hypothetical protein
VAEAAPVALPALQGNRKYGCKKYLLFEQQMVQFFGNKVLTCRIRGIDMSSMEVALLSARLKVR